MKLIRSLLTLLLFCTFLLTSCQSRSHPAMYLGSSGVGVTLLQENNKTVTILEDSHFSYILTVSERSIYYVCLDGTIWRYDLEEKEAYHLLDKSVVSYASQDEEFIYLGLGMTNGTSCIYIFLKDSNELKKVISITPPLGSQDWVFVSYIDEQNVYYTVINASQPTATYCMNIDGSNSRKLFEGNMTVIHKDSKNIYYTLSQTDSIGIYKSDLDFKHAEYIVPEGSDGIIQGDTLYYLKAQGLYTTSLDGTKTKKLCNDAIRYNYFIQDDVIYYIKRVKVQGITGQVLSADGHLYSIHSNGSNKKCLLKETINSVFPQ